MKELMAFMYMLVRDNKFQDIALSNVRVIKSIKEFNGVNEMLGYIDSTYCDSVLIKKLGKEAYTEKLYLHQIEGFKLNQKSATFKLRDGSNKNIRF